MKYSGQVQVFMTIDSVIIRLIKDKSGATAVEYALILAMIVLVMIVALDGVATETVGIWDNIAEKSAAATSGQ